jgi:8-oxo-dGTP diphosphatase
MPAEEQVVGSDRYVLIPRTLVFATREGAYLLVKGAAGKRIWSGLYNGVGGHLERGEDALSAARREFREETGLEAQLWLCGTVVVDAGVTGIGLYVFTGEAGPGTLLGSAEGEPEWILPNLLGRISTVSDVAAILGQIQSMKRGDPPFSGRSSYDRAGRLLITFQR